MRTPNSIDRNTASGAVPAALGWKRWSRDPRHFQIVVLSSLILYGTTAFDLGIRLAFVPLLVGTALLTQLLCTRLAGLPVYDARSPLISSLSLVLLLRTADWQLAVLAAVITIASKFLLRVDGKHVFNPTSFGLVAMMLLTDAAWVSPGQWGSVAILGAAIACVGALVVRRAARSDVTFAFIASYAAIVLGRSLWLGDPLAVPLHHLQSGALILFAFFMISDPRTTPDSRAGRIVWAGLIAIGAAYVHFVLYTTNGFLWALVASAPLVPLINRILPGTRHAWAEANTTARKKGPDHVHVSPRPRPRAAELESIERHA